MTAFCIQFLNFGLLLLHWTVELLSNKNHIEIV